MVTMPVHSPRYTEHRWQHAFIWCMLLYVYLYKWNLQLYSLAKFHKTTISMNKEGKQTY